jgi:tetratricopeptide (TPR) repeat protein
MEDEADSCLINLCACLLESDDSTKPLEYLRELRERARTKYLPRIEAGALNLLAKASRRSNQPAEAEVYCLEAIRIWQRLGSVEKTAMNIANLGNAYKDQGKLEEAERAYLEAQHLAIEHALTRQHAHCLELMCALRLEQERVSESIDFGIEALAMHRRAADPLRLATILEKLGEAYKLAARRGDAIAAFEEAAGFYGAIEKWDDAAEAFETAATLALGNNVESDRLVEQGIQAALRTPDAMRVVKLLEVGQASDSVPPYIRVLEYLLNPGVVPHMGLFMTNVALQGSKLSPSRGERLMQDVIDRLFTRATEADGLEVLTGIAVALLQTASHIPDTCVKTICNKIQGIEGVYYRDRTDGSGIWTIGLAWEKPIIVQVDMLSEYVPVQRIALALVIYILANGRVLGGLVQHRGGNLEEGLRFMLCTEGDYKTYILEGKYGETGVSPDHPVTVMESGVPWGAPQPPAIIILHDDFAHLADISGNLDAMASKLLLAHVTLDFIAHCTHSSREHVKESLSIVRGSFH